MIVNQRYYNRQLSKCREIEYILSCMENDYRRSNRRQRAIIKTLLKDGLRRVSGRAQELIDKITTGEL